MLCPKCHANNDKVNESRPSKEGDVIRRRRQCLVCGFRFTTYESIIPADIYVVKRDGRREDFKLEKLRSGIKMACWKRNISQEQIDAIVGDITNRLTLEPRSEVESRYIGELVMEALRNVDEVAYVRFASVYRQFKDPGEFLEAVRTLPSQTAPEQAGTEQTSSSQVASKEEKR